MIPQDWKLDLGQLPPPSPFDFLKKGERKCCRIFAEINRKHHHSSGPSWISACCYVWSNRNCDRQKQQPTIKSISYCILPSQPISIQAFNQSINQTDSSDSVSFHQSNNIIPNWKSNNDAINHKIRVDPLEQCQIRIPNNNDGNAFQIHHFFQSSPRRLWQHRNPHSSQNNNLSSSSNTHLLPSTHRHRSHIHILTQQGNRNTPRHQPIRSFMDRTQLRHHGLHS